MKKDEFKRELVSLIQAELDDISNLVEELKRCRGSNQILKRAKRYILQDFYNACERIFELICARNKRRIAFSRAVAQETFVSDDFVN